MAGSYKRLLNARTLTAGWEQPLEAAIDVGGFRRLEVQVRLVKVGTAGTLSLESAPVNEDDAYQAVAGSSVNLDGTGTTDGKKQVSIDAFFRFLRVVTDAQAAGGAVATVDVVAKE